MEKVDFVHRTRLVFGPGEIARLGILARECGARRALVVSDPGVVSAGHFDRGVESLKAHQAYIDGLGWENFDPSEFLEGMSRPTGSRLGVTHAAPFEVFSMTFGE